MKLDRFSFDEAIANMMSNPKYAGSYLFYAHMLAQCRIHITMDIPTAGVNFTLDHYNLYVNPEFFATLTLEQRLACLKHEMLHILNGHIVRRQDRDHQAFNYAADCAINQHIDRKHCCDDWVFPDNLPSKHKVTPNNSAEQYYEMIDKDKLPPQNGGGSSDSGDGSGTPDGTKGDHGKWDESTGDKELQDDLTKNMIEKSISSTQKSRGDVPSSISQWLDMFTHKRELDWRKVLRGIVGNKKVGTRRTIMRQDRRLPNFEWIKGRTKDRMFDLLVISDVSGSVSDDALLSLWGEVRFICDITQSNVDLIQVDTRPSKPEKLAKNTRIIERKACGGTNLSPAIAMAKKEGLKFNAVVVTTDGYLSDSDVAEFAKLKQRVIWLVEKDGQIMDSMNSGRMKAFQLKE